ncbi:NUDIX domain-containing protein [Patescibacteria group bacterium]|nr:NUDIX domain-containing protein [Patescibacteria group bacterium]
MKPLLKLWKKLPFSRAARVFILKILNDQFIIGVTGVIFNDKNQILVLKHTYRKVPWSLPGGYLKADEHPKVGLAREIEEETGFVVHIIRIIKTKAEKDGRLDISYFGEYKSGKFRPSAEVTNYRFVAVDKLPELIEDQYEQIAEAVERKKLYDRQQRWKFVTHKVPHFFRNLLPKKHDK